MNNIRMKQHRKICGKKNWGEITYQVVCTVIVAVFALMCLYPLLYVVGISFTTQQEWAETGGKIFLFPSHPSFAAYTRVFKSGSDVLRALWVSVQRTVLGTVGGVIVAAVLGYVLSRKNLPGKGIITFLVLITIFFSISSIPNFIVVRDLNLLNSLWSLVLPALLNTWYALIFKQFFEGIPEEVEEAAHIDGVSEFQLFYKIVLPMSGPVLAAIALFTMVAHWNAYFDVMLYNREDKSWWTLQYYVKTQFDNSAQADQGDLGNWENIVGTKDDVALIAKQMALTVVSLLPVLIAYPFFQKYFTKGVYMGAIK